MGLDWILETINQFGFEGEIEYWLKKDGSSFTIGILDLANIDSDGKTYLGCQVIQNTKIANFKKQLTTTVDILGNKNIKDYPITPAPTVKFLKKSTPITKTSSWNNSFKTVSSGTGSYVTIISGAFFSFNQNINQSEVSNTLSSVAEVQRFNQYFGGTEFRSYTLSQWNSGGSSYVDSNNGDCMKLLKAKNRLTNTSIRVKLKGNCYLYDDAGYTDQIKLAYIVQVSTGGISGNIDSGNYQRVINIPLVKFSTTNIDVDETITLNVPIEISQYLYGYWTLMRDGADFHAMQGGHRASLTIQDTFVQVTASQKSLDIVISGVRYIDMIKQCSKFINNTPVDAAIFDVGGEHYNNVCYNRGLLSPYKNNSIVLNTVYDPEGMYVGQVVNNTVDNGIMPIGKWFWNGSSWRFLDSAYGVIEQIYLTAPDTPAGYIEGQLIFNTNNDVEPTGLCYWSNSNVWVGLEQYKPFITTFQDVAENSMTIETCSDYEIKQDKIYFGKYQNYYEDTEIAVFDIIPSKDFKVSWNDKFKVNNLKISYDTFETNRFSENTNEDMHTETEWNIPNVYVENKIDKSIKYVRSAMSAQVMIDLEISKPATAFENDEKVFIESITDLAPYSWSPTIKATLNMSIVNGDKLQILNTDSNGDQDVVINWNLFGFDVGSAFEITSGSNAGFYFVVSFTNSILLLNFQSVPPSYAGDSFIGFHFMYSNVLWQTKTAEGYTLIDGLNSNLTYPNLDYTPKDTLLRWGSYLKSACLSHQDKIIKKLKFRNDSKLKKQKTGESLQIQKADVLISDLPTPILTEKIYDLEVTASFTTLLNLLNTMSTTRGYVRCLDETGLVILGHIKDLDYLWKTESLKLTLEEKWQSEILEVTTLNYAWYEINFNYIRFFDSDDKPLTNPRHFSKVSINGTVYDSMDLLKQNLLYL